MKLVKSRWRFRGNNAHTRTFLRSLGIESHKAEDRNFWQANASILSELYEKMETKARLKLHELHPDKGGSDAEFSAFMEAHAAVKKRFLYHLPRKLAGLPLAPDKFHWNSIRRAARIKKA